MIYLPRVWTLIPLLMAGPRVSTPGHLQMPSGDTPDAPRPIPGFRLETFVTSLTKPTQSS